MRTLALALLLTLATGCTTAQLRTWCPNCLATGPSRPGDPVSASIPSFSVHPR